MKKFVFLLSFSCISIFYAFSQPLSGTYTIGGSSPDYATFTAAVAALVNNGVSGPVVFQAADGTYNEQLVIPAITGASAVNTVTFTSGSGNPAGVVLTYAAPDASHDYIIYLNAASHITFRALTFRPAGTTYGRTVYQSGATTGNRFLENNFNGGTYALFLQGGYNDYVQETVIRDNTFTDQTQQAVHIEYSRHSVIAGNRILTTAHIEGVRISGLSDGDTLTANDIRLANGGLGIHFYSCLKTATDTTLLANNFIYLNTTVADHAIDMFSLVTPVKILFNTVHITGMNPYSYCLYLNGNGHGFYKMVMNNILSNEASGKAVSYYHLPDHSDHNDLYTNGVAPISYYNAPEMDIDTWREDFHRDLHSVTVDPYFTTTGSYEAENLALNGTALPRAGLTTDLEGNMRDAVRPDIGALEFTPTAAPLHGTFSVGGATADYNSLKDAVKALETHGVDGAVTFRINTGTYEEQLVIPPVRGASVGDTVTFTSATGDSSDVRITFAPVSYNKNYTIFLDGADFIRFDRVWIESDSATGTPLLLKNGAFYNAVTHCILRVPANSTGILVQIGGTTGSYAHTDSSNIFSYNYMKNGRYAVNTGDAGNRNVPQATFNTLVRNNVIRGGTLSLLNGTNSTVTGNDIRLTVRTNWTKAIALSEGSAANNFVYMENPDSYNYIGITTYNDSWILFNTVSTAGPNGIPLQTNGVSYILNNILVTEGSTALKLADTTGCSIDRNIYFSANTMRCIAYNPGGTWYFSLENWKKSASFDGHSLFYDPLFTTPDDLHTLDPWCNARALPIAGLSTDIDGDARDPLHPDIGADEFDGVSPLKGNYTIGTSGDFPSFSAVADTLVRCGVEDSVVFRVLEGTYDEQFTLRGSDITRLPDTAAIVFRAARSDSGAVTLQYAATDIATDNYVVTLDSASYVTFEGITFRNTGSGRSRMILFTRPSRRITFVNNIFAGQESDDAICYSDGSGRNVFNRFINNRFYNGGYGIVLIGLGPNQPHIGTVIRHNRFFNQKETTIFLSSSRKMEITGNRISYTLARENTWTGITISLSTEGMIANNAISFLTNGSSSGIYLDFSTYIKIYYNSIYVTGAAENSRCYNQLNLSDHNILKNNLLANHAGGAAMWNDSPETFTSDHNGFYVSGTGRFIFTDHWLHDLPAWHSEYGQDAHSYQHDPAFYSPDSLYTTAPLFNGTAQVLEEVNRDLTGKMRDAVHPDMGVYEFTGHYTLGRDTVICRRTSVVLDAGAGYDSYLWNTGATTQTLRTDSLNDDGTHYRVTVTVGGATYSDSLTVSFKGPDINLGDDTTVCENHTVVLDAGEGAGYTYLWSTGHTSRLLPASNTGTYWVTVTDGEGCRGSDTVTVYHYDPVTVTLSFDGTTLSAGYRNGTYYNWYRDGKRVAYGTEYFMTPDSSGNYWSWLTDEHGCSAFSDTLYVSLTGITGVQAGRMTLYPNPNNGHFSISFTRTTGVKEIAVYNVPGRMVWIDKPDDLFMKQKEIDLSGLPDGLYLLKINTEEQIIFRRFIIKRQR